MIARLKRAKPRIVDDDDRGDCDPPPKQNERLREDAHPASRHEILLRSYGWKGKDEQQELELRGDSNKA